MPNATTYGGIKLGTDNPFAGISTEMITYGGKLCSVQKLIVQGKLYLCASNNPNKSQQKDILKEVSDFQKAVMVSYQTASAGGFTLDNAVCTSLSITNSDYLGAEYNVEFTAYPNNFFSDIVGILDPVDTVKATENKDGSISIVRNISAKGISTVTVGDGLTKVKGWINSLNPKTLPTAVQFLNTSLNFKGSAISPRRVQEVTNRAEGTMSVEVEFIFNTGGSNPTLLMFSINTNYDDRAGIYTSTLNGTITGGIDNTVDELESALKSFTPFTHVQAAAPLSVTFLEDLVSSSKETDETKLQVSS
jgi:hypothetical protein